MSNLALVVNNNNITAHENNPFFDFFNEYLTSQRSENTRKAYNTDLKQFFKFTFNKKPQDVTFTDIASLTSTEALRYYNSLSGKNATIKRKIDSVKSFLSSLAVDHNDINTRIFDNIKLASVDLDREAWGNIDWDEAFLFIEYAHIEQMSGDQMAMAMKLSCISAIRLETLLSLTWEDHFRRKVEKGVLIHYIDAIDKGTRHQTPISQNFYNELREKLGETGKLFPDLHPHKVGRYLKQILNYFEIDPKRNIKFHSFKKCGVNRVLDRTGDLTKAQLQGKHKSIITTQNNYIEYKDTLSSKPSYTLDEEINIVDKVKNLSHEELLNAIAQMSECSKFELLRIVEKGK